MASAHAREVAVSCILAEALAAKTNCSLSSGVSAATCTATLIWRRFATRIDTISWWKAELPGQTQLSYDPIVFRNTEAG